MKLFAGATVNSFNGEELVITNFVSPEEYRLVSKTGKTVEVSAKNKHCFKPDFEKNRKLILPVPDGFTISDGKLVGEDGDVATGNIVVDKIIATIPGKIVFAGKIDDEGAIFTYMPIFDEFKKLVKTEGNFIVEDFNDFYIVTEEFTEVADIPDPSDPSREKATAVALPRGAKMLFLSKETGYIEVRNLASPLGDLVQAGTFFEKVYEPDDEGPSTAEKLLLLRFVSNKEIETTEDGVSILVEGKVETVYTLLVTKDVGEDGTSPVDNNSVRIRVNLLYTNFGKDEQVITANLQPNKDVVVVLKTGIKVINGYGDVRVEVDGINGDDIASFPNLLEIHKGANFTHVNLVDEDYNVKTITVQHYADGRGDIVSVD